MSVPGSASFSTAATNYGRNSADAYFYLSAPDTVNGPLTVTGNLVVNGTSTLTGPVSTGSTLAVGGNLSVTGNETVTGTLTTSGALQVNAAATVTGALSVAGNISAPDGTVNVTGGLGVSGAVTANTAIQCFNAPATTPYVSPGFYTSGTVRVTGINVPINTALPVPLITSLLVSPVPGTLYCTVIDATNPNSFTVFSIDCPGNQAVASAYSITVVRQSILAAALSAGPSLLPPYTGLAIIVTNPLAVTTQLIYSVTRLA